LHLQLLLFDLQPFFGRADVAAVMACYGAFLSLLVVGFKIANASPRERK